MYQQSKFVFLLVLYMQILVIDILNQILLILLAFIALQILQRYQLVIQGFSLVYNFMVWAITYMCNLHLDE